MILLYEFIEKNALELVIEELDRKEARMVLDGVNSKRFIKNWNKRVRLFCKGNELCQTVHY